MKDHLEEFIRENRENLDLNEPSEGHLERFEQKLRTEQDPSSSFDFKSLWKVAAVITVLIGSLYMFLGDYGDNTVIAGPNDGVSLKDVSPEMAEVEYYYEASLGDMINEAKKKQDWDTTNYTESLLHLKDLEWQYDLLKKDLEKNYGDERVVNAMIQNYRVRVQLMNELINGLEIAKQNKAGTNEKVNN